MKNKHIPEFISLCFILLFFVWQCAGMYIFPLMYINSEKTEQKIEDIPLTEANTETEKLSKAKILAYTTRIGTIPEYGGAGIYAIAVYPDRTITYIKGTKKEGYIGLDTADPFESVEYIKREKISEFRYKYLIRQADKMYKHCAPHDASQALIEGCVLDIRYKGNRYYDSAYITFDGVEAGHSSLVEDLRDNYPGGRLGA